MSSLAYDSATYGWSVRPLYGAMLKDIHDSSLEIELGGRWALLPDLYVAIVNATVINGAKRFRTDELRNQDCSFGGNTGASEVNKPVMRIEQDVGFCTVVGFMLAHGGSSFSDIGIDKPKYYMLRGVFLFEALYLRNVAIGDGAVGCREEEHNRFRAGRSKTCNRLPIQGVAIRYL
ncbi:MAG: hypothetical protein WA419_06385 [Silvibacterium sp.]